MAGVRNAVSQHEDRLIALQDGKCGICGEPLALEPREVDHLIPKSVGGSHFIDNLQVAHSHCNQRKRNRFVQTERFGPHIPVVTWLTGAIAPPPALCKTCFAPVPAGRTRYCSEECAGEGNRNRARLARLSRRRRRAKMAATP